LRRLFENKVFIISLVVISLFVLAALTAKENGKLNVFRNVFSVPLNPLQRGIKSVGDSIKGTINFFRDARTSQQENAELKKRLQEAERDLEKVYRLEMRIIKNCCLLKINLYRNWWAAMSHQRMWVIGLRYSQLTGEARTVLR